MAGKPLDQFYIIAFGDNKGCSNVSTHAFSDEEKGHLTDFATELFKAQQFRRNGFVYGFLTNGIAVQWFRFKDHDGMSTGVIEYPPVLFKTEGLQSICNMLATEPTLLGWKLPEVVLRSVPVELTQVLGHGAFSVVYRGLIRNNNTEIVVKHFNKDVTDPLSSVAKHRDVELDMLHRLQNVPHVTKCIGLSEDKQSIIITPLGLQFARFVTMGNLSYNSYLYKGIQHRRQMQLQVMPNFVFVLLNISVSY